MSRPSHAERGSEQGSLYRHLRLVKISLGILATGLTIARALGLL